MKRKITALLATLAILLTATPASAATYPLNGHGPYPDSTSGYSYWIEVCVSASTGSTTWNTAGIPLHARAAEALSAWNAINGELRFSMSNSCVTPETMIIIEKGNYGAGAGFKSQLANADWIPSCSAPWDCISIWYLKINLYYPWWNQDGTPNPNQYDLESAFVHEFGHALSAPDLGTAHPYCNYSDANKASMCGFLPIGTSWMRTLSSEDINSYASRYGTTH